MRMVRCGMNRMNYRLQTANRRIYYLVLLMVVLINASAFAGIIIEVKNINNNVITNAVYFGTNKITLTTNLITPLQYAFIRYTNESTNIPWNIQIYTYNTNYMGSGNSSGLVLETTRDKRIPVLYRVYDSLQSGGVACSNTDDWGSVMDRQDSEWYPGNTNYAIISGLNSDGILAPYPVSGRTLSTNDPLYIYFVCDCRQAVSNAMGGTYGGIIHFDMNYLIPPSLTISSINPDKGFSSDRNVSIKIKGAGFQTGATILLRKEGESDILAFSAAITPDTIIAYFDLSQAERVGRYDMVIINSDSETGILPEGFIVQGYDMKGNRLVPVNNFYDKTKVDKVAIKWSLEQAQKVHLKIYNMKGEIVKNILDNEHCEAGAHQYDWYGKNDSGLDVGSGIYFVYIKAGSFEAKYKIVLVK
ncbi:MAG: hypothetical protein JW827_05680 [Spirochaetes bacterium]|nr:hypothetical protein [Spirochaetota bacterium]